MIFYVFALLADWLAAGGLPLKSSGWGMQLQRYSYSPQADEMNHLQRRLLFKPKIVAGIWVLIGRGMRLVNMELMQRMCASLLQN